MTERLRSEGIILRGTYGDMEIHVRQCFPKSPNNIHIILLHGVHSSANIGLHNKFRYLAELLVDCGFTAWLVETSRKLRNRLDFADNIGGWIKGAFDGKTFAQEQEDFFMAIREIIRRVSPDPIWIWGFSLGGIIALSAAAGAIEPPDGKQPAIDRIILSGTGLVAYQETESHMMKMPILSTLYSSLSQDMITRVRTNGCILFRGSEDEIFPEQSCLDLLEGIELPAESKYFHTVKGADHSLRLRNRKNAPDIMQEMVEFIVKTWL